MHELRAIEIPFVRCASGGQDDHNECDGQQSGVKQRHPVATFADHRGSEIGTERQAQPKQWCGREKLKPADETIGAHERATASTVSIPRGDSLATTKPVIAIVAQTETSRTSRMTHHWVAIIGR